MFFGSRRATKSVAAAEAAALAAFRVASLGDRVGAIVFSEQGSPRCRTKARQRRVRHFLAELVRHNRACLPMRPPTDPPPFDAGAPPRGALRRPRSPAPPDLRRLGRRCPRRRAW